MNAFVTGATGLLGNNLVRLLVAQGHRVSALVRDPAKAQRLLGDLDIATVQGDMLDVAGFAGHLAGVEVVYHAAAYFREYYQPGDHWPKLHAINVEGTQALLEAADAHGVRRFVHVSSGGVLERSDDRASDEHDRASDEHDRASDEHDRASDEHDRASDEHDRASDEHDRASDEHDRASDEHDRASDEHDRASDEHDRASDEHDRASDEHDRASDEHDRASDEHDRASDEHDRASDEHDRASDEHDRASDEHDRASGLALDNLYFRSKVETEKVIETFLARHDMPVVIILPGWMFGPGDAAPTSAGQLVLDFLNRNLPGIPTRGGGSVADARDVAGCHDRGGRARRQRSALRRRRHIPHAGRDRCNPRAGQRRSRPAPAGALLAAAHGRLGLGDGGSPTRPRDAADGQRCAHRARPLSDQLQQSHPRPGGLLPADRGDPARHRRLVPEPSPARLTFARHDRDHTMATTGPTLREQRQLKRRREILDAALERFAAEGYQGASMEEIAEAALLTRAGLYKHYPDKASLLGELRRWKLEQLTERVTAALGGAVGLEARVGAIIRKTLAFQDEHPGFFQILFTAGTLPELAANDAFTPYGALLTNVMIEGANAGDLGDFAPPEELAMMLVSLMFKNPIKRNVLGYEPPTSLERDAALMERVFLRGVRNGRGSN